MDEIKQPHERLTPPAAGPVAARTRALGGWLVFGPLVALMLLHFWLKTEAENLPSVQPLRCDIQAESGGMWWLWSFAVPVLLVVALTAAFLLALRAWGWRRVAPKLLALWLALCALAAAGLVWNYLNLAGLQPMPQADATVAQARARAASEYGPGGALAILQLAPDAAWCMALLEGADASALRPGQRLRLQRARGRFRGVYVTGFDAPAP